MSRVSISLCLLPLLTACATTKIVEKPVPVEVVRTEYVAVPSELTSRIAPQAIPDRLTYGQAIELWAADRSAVESLNARLAAIQALSE